MLRAVSPQGILAIVSIKSGYRFDCGTKSTESLLHAGSIVVGESGHSTSLRRLFAHFAAKTTSRLAGSVSVDVTMSAAALCYDSRRTKGSSENSRSSTVAKGENRAINRAMYRIEPDVVPPRHE
jgi:hypothetical protein